MQIRLKASLIVVALAVVTSGTAAYAAYSADAAMIADAEESELQCTAAVLQAAVQTKSSGAASRAALIANLPVIQDRLRARDGAGLTALLQGTFGIQKAEFGISEANFHLAPAISFLRVFDPSAPTGMDVSKYREMVVAANRRHESQRGIEIARQGLSIRGVIPVPNGDGDFEVGLSFGTVLSDAKKMTNCEAGVFVDEQRFASIATSVPKPDPERIIGGYRNVESTDWQAIRAIATPDLLSHNSEASFGHRVINGSEMGTVVLPLLDFKGKAIGSIVAVKNLEHFQSMARKSLVRSIGFAFLQAMVLIGTLQVVVNALLLRPLERLAVAVDGIAAGQAATTLTEMAKAPNEIGRLARSLARLDPKAADGAASGRETTV